MNSQTFTDLVYSCLHFNYRFYTPAREMLKRAYEDGINKSMIDGVIFNLNDRDQSRIKKILGKE